MGKGPLLISKKGALYLIESNKGNGPLGITITLALSGGYGEINTIRCVNINRRRFYAFCLTQCNQFLGL